METIAKCPVCEKGSLVVGTMGYSCNHFKSVEDQCRFTIYKEYFGKEITPEIALQLCEEGETEIYDDLCSKEGKTFSASLILDKEHNVVKPNFADKEFELLEHDCPSCGSKVQITSKGYICQNYFKGECKLFISNTIAGTDIRDETAEVLLAGEKTGIMDFTTQEGEVFAARLALNPELQVKFDSTICKCPKCETGNISGGKKAFNCSNYKNEEVKCDFTIWREISGKEITPQIVLQLCETGETEALTGFKSKEGEPFERKMILTDDKTVKLI